MNCVNPINSNRGQIGIPRKSEKLQMKNIYCFRFIALSFCAVVVALTFSPRAVAQRADKRTVVTFSQPIEIPGVGQQYLPAGKYVFKLVDSLSSRDIVQIFSEDESHVFATILTIANYRLKATDETVMTFRERAAGKPEAIRAWFYPGANWGQEFVYPKTRAVELAKLTNEPVLFIPSELAAEIIKPVKSIDEPPVVALKKAPIMAVLPRGEEVEIAQVVQAPPAQVASVRPTRLPQTSSQLPLVGLLGLLSLSAGFGISIFARRIS
jgi:hypothetical protein